MDKNVVCLLVSALAFDAVFGIAGAQEAATGRSQPATQLETIVVTARKRTEDIQSVPISVTAVSGTDLENQNVRTVGEVVLTVPNMSVTSGSNSATAPTYTIRGQVQNDTTAAVDPSVGIYVDGVYWARAHGSNAALLDVSQVEVLRGPQGTLFGRNTTGGAINMTTNDPNFDGFSGSGSVGFGNYDQVDFSGVLNMPITADRLAARIAVNQQQNHGWIKDEVTDERYSRSRQWIGRGKLLFTPTDALSFVLSGEYFDYDGGAPVEQLAFILPPNAVGPNGAPLGLGAIEALLESGFTDNGQRHVVDDDSDAIDRISLDRPDRTWTESQTYSLRGALDTEWGTLKSIVAYRKVDTSSKLDLDGTPYEIFNVTFNESNVDQWTGELQASGLALDERLNWTVGAYYFTEDGVDQTAAQTVTAILGNRAASPSGSFIENDSYAGYAQGTYRLTDAWSLTAGLRYSSDERHKRQFQDIANPANPICPAGTTPRSSGRCEAAFKRTDSDWSYTFGLDYQFTPDILGYVKTSRGYRAGGFNTRGGADLPGGGAFGPETVTDYEVGLKSEFLDNRVRLNLAVYYSDYRDIQSTLLTLNPDTNQGAVVVQNAAKGEIVGFEAEATALVTEGLLLSGSVGYTDAEYLDFEDLTGDRSDEEFPLVPKWTASASVQYTREIPIGSVLLRTDYSYKDSIVFQRNLFPPYTEAPPTSLVNARIGLTVMDGKVDIAAYGRNLFDRRAKTFALDLASAGLGFVSNIYGEPRRYGVELTARF